MPLRCRDKNKMPPVTKSARRAGGVSPVGKSDREIQRREICIKSHPLINGGAGPASDFYRPGKAARSPATADDGWPRRTTAGHDPSFSFRCHRRPAENLQAPNEHQHDTVPTPSAFPSRQEWAAMLLPPSVHAPHAFCTGSS